MSYKNAIQSYYCDLHNLLEMLDHYVRSHRDLSICLNEISENPLIAKKRKKEAINRVNQVGCMIDVVLCAIYNAQSSYLKYVQLKCEALSEIITFDFVRLEIEHELLEGVPEEYKERILTLQNMRRSSKHEQNPQRKPVKGNKELK